MKITFGIITAADSRGYIPSRINDVFASIATDESYDDIEVLVVGGNETKTWEHYRFIAFDESQKDKWITRKKNIITAEAKYDNIVYMHDYVKLGRGWYKGMEEFGENWDVLMTPIKNQDGTRYRDWSLWPHDLDKVWGPHCRECLIPYTETELSKLMYISGAYWIAKRKVMQEFPLNEDLSWGQSEDVEWSKRVRQKYKFSINEKSVVWLAQQKDRVFTEPTPETLKKVKEYNATL